MPDTKFAPYAPPATVLGTIRHYRTFDPPEYLTTTNLRQIGVTESLLPRTITALRFLKLIREDMTTTDQFRALRFADEDQYQTLLRDMLNESYKDVLDNLDLSTATERQINNAFIPYTPGGQRERMITLFLALAREAGWTIAATGKAGTPRTPPKRGEAGRARMTRMHDARKDRDRETVTPEPEQRPPSTTAPGLLFGVTDADLAALPDDEFDSVWAALGKIAKARAKALRTPKSEGEPPAGGQ